MNEVGVEIPASGMLSFFYDSTQSVFGYDKADHAGWSVEWFQDLDDLRLARAEALPELQIPFRPLAVLPRIEWTLPQWPSLALDRVGLGPLFDSGNTDLTDRYLSLLATTSGRVSGTAVHRMFGHPDQLQTDMSIECEIVSRHGTLDPAALGPGETARVAAAANRWKLLLQVDSDDDLGTSWADGGRLYFWIPEDALALGDFSQTHLIVQSS